MTSELGHAGHYNIAGSNLLLADTGSGKAHCSRRSIALVSVGVGMEGTVPTGHQASFKTTLPFPNDRQCSGAI